LDLSGITIIFPISLDLKRYRTVKIAVLGGPHRPKPLKEAK
jgi:hypothetical protein